MLLGQHNLTVGSVLRQRIDSTVGALMASTDARRTRSGYALAIVARRGVARMGAHAPSMPRARLGPTAVAILTLLLASALAPRPEAQTVDIESAWKERLRRPVQPPPSPADNSLSPERIALGARLFADPRLSGAGDRACATCHRPDKAFTDGRRRALGLSGASLQRNTPALWNLAWGKHFFWDGRASSLEEQVAMPIVAARRDGRRLADDSRATGTGHRPRRPIPSSALGRAGRIAGGCRCGACNLRALARLAADPLRCLGRGRE